MLIKDANHYGEMLFHDQDCSCEKDGVGFLAFGKWLLCVCFEMDGDDVFIQGYFKRRYV